MRCIHGCLEVRSPAQADLHLDRLSWRLADLSVVPRLPPETGPPSANADGQGGLGGG